MNIHSLGYIGVNCSDPAKWQHYGTQVLGLQDVTDTIPVATDGEVFLKMDDRPYRIIVSQSEQDGFGFCGWEVAGPDDFAAAIQDLENAGVSFTRATPEEASQRCVQDLVSFADPEGNKHEVYWGVVSDFGRFNSPIGVPGFVTGDQGLGHVVLPAPNFDKTVEFYKKVMGFDMADLMKVRFTPDPSEPEKRLFFMHCNERHHSLALFEMPHPAGCIHTMLEVPNVDEVGRAMDRMAANNVKLTGTLGRHANDHMVSFYMETPSGFMMEYGAEGRTVEDWSRYTPFQSTVNSFWGHDFSVGVE